jgi:hypothetical protein
MRGLTFEKPKDRYSLSECYANFLTILRIYRTTMIFYLEFVQFKSIQMLINSNNISCAFLPRFHGKLLEECEIIGVVFETTLGIFNIFC